jgi:dTDP-glucose 4,6-dehydratase
MIEKKQNLAVKRAPSTIAVSGGAGFIGSNFIRYLLSEDHFTGRIINLDALTYAGNAYSLSDIDSAYGSGAGDASRRRYFFEHVDICDRKAIEAIFDRYNIDTVVHFAAESHVDRSILDP